MGGFFLERVLHYLALLVPRGQRSHTYDAGKKVDTGATVKLSLITRVLISQGTPCGRQQQNYHRGRSTSIPLPQKHSFPSTGCSESRNYVLHILEKMQCRQWIKTYVGCILYYVYLYIECEKLEPNIFFVFILGGKKYENHISKIIYFFFFGINYMKKMCTY